MKQVVIVCDGPMCEKRLEYARPDIEPAVIEGWYTVSREGLYDAHFCNLNCIWQWSKEVVHDPSDGMGPYYAKYKKEQP